MSVVKVIDFSSAPHEWEHRRLADLPERVVLGDPHHKAVTRYDSGETGLSAGTWISTPGRWHAFTDRDEFCVILSGHVRLIAKDGSAQTFKTGDSFLIPNGFEGYWDVIETTTKHYVIRSY
jgi:uncharacterized protein